MANILGIKKVNDLLGDFEFHEFCIVDELRVFCANGELCIKMFLRTENRQPTNFSLEVLFKGVVNANIQPFQNALGIRIMDLDIIDISDRQLEGLFWQINDFEENSISWSCRDIEIVSVNDNSRCRA